MMKELQTTTSVRNRYMRDAHASRRGSGGEEEGLRPDVDLAGSLVEEEHVLYEHETAGLRDGGEEAVQDARGHKGLEARCCGAPCCCQGGEDEEPEEDWQTAEVGAAHDDWRTGESVCDAG